MEHRFIFSSSSSGAWCVLICCCWKYTHYFHLHQNLNTMKRKIAVRIVSNGIRWAWAKSCWQTVGIDSLSVDSFASFVCHINWLLLLVVVVVLKLTALHVFYSFTCSERSIQFGVAHHVIGFCLEYFRLCPRLSKWESDISISFFIQFKIAIPIVSEGFSFGFNIFFWKYRNIA